jgi:hypothetical protein
VTDELDRVVAALDTRRPTDLLPVRPYKTSRELAALEETSWLIRKRWPADAYGVLGAEDKAGKTWAVLDLAVSVVSGTPLFGSIPVDVRGPVTLFLGKAAGVAWFAGSMRCVASAVWTGTSTASGSATASPG